MMIKASPRCQRNPHRRPSSSSASGFFVAGTLRVPSLRSRIRRPPLAAAKTPPTSLSRGTKRRRPNNMRPPAVSSTYSRACKISMVVYRRELELASNGRPSCYRGRKGAVQDTTQIESPKGGVINGILNRCQGTPHRRPSPIGAPVMLRQSNSVYYSNHRCCELSIA
jgi:hypothetical protein